MQRCHWVITCNFVWGHKRIYTTFSTYAVVLPKICSTRALTWMIGGVKCSLLSFFFSKELKVWHRPHIDCLAAAGADLIAFETIPSIKEAEALVELLREFPDSKAWLALSCKVTTATEQHNYCWFIVNCLASKWFTFCTKPLSGWEVHIRRQPVHRRGADC